MDFNDMPDDHPPFAEAVKAGKLHNDGPIVVAMPWTGDWSEYLPGTSIVPCQVCGVDSCISPEARELPNVQPICLMCAREILPMDAVPGALRQTMERARDMGFEPYIERFLRDGGSLGDAFAAMDEAERQGAKSPMNPTPAWPFAKMAREARSKKGRDEGRS